MPTMKVREVIRMIEAEGWRLDRQAQLEWPPRG
jgi:predicted RNA binding protein YcfA (HicA-like mRNA interferase family)